MVEASSELTLFGTYEHDPVGFAEKEMCVSLNPGAKCLLRSLMKTGRMGLSGRYWLRSDVRILEIVVAVWRLVTRPLDDVLVALPNQRQWGIWLSDASRVIAHARPQLTRELLMTKLGIMHKGIGFGKVWCFLGVEGVDVPEPRGESSTLIVSGMDDASLDTMKQGCAKFALPRLMVATTYRAP